MTAPIIIIGSGLAGYMLAKEFRQLDAKTPLQIITSSDGRFYSKPLLSTALTSAKLPENLAIADANSMANQLNATIRTCTEVSAIDIHARCICIKQEKIPYSKLILACGAQTIKPPIIGNAAKDILSVNDLEAYAAFRKIINAKKNIVILGAGLVGCEFANDLLNANYHVDIITPANYPMENLLPEQIGLMLQQTLAEQGATWHLGQTALEVNHFKNGYAINLSSNKKLLADFVMSAIGLQPNIDLAKQAGINTARGVIVNEFLQTSADHVYALGDCAEVNGLVLLFVAPLLQCARALAKTLTEEKTKVIYPVMPITLKTPALPIVVLPPLRNLSGQWKIEGNDKHVKALFYDEKNQLRGFVLTGNKIREKQTLISALQQNF